MVVLVRCALLALLLGLAAFFGQLLRLLRRIENGLLLLLEADCCGDARERRRLVLLLLLLNLLHDVLPRRQRPPRVLELLQVGPVRHPGSFCFLRR